MRLEYTDAEGNIVEVALGNTEVLIGRSPQCHVVLASPDVSRQHASIRLWGDDYVIKDLGSENGLYVNGQRVEIAVLRDGDVIRVGSCEIHVRQSISERAPSTVIREIESKMAHGKGFSTIMKEIVHEVEEKKKED
jgi:pSer/pThr/pTyr-binding forkhead associated (FHA) protein